jgi:hypothetical protein
VSVKETQLVIQIARSATVQPRSNTAPLMACPEIRDFVVHYRAHLDCQASAARLRRAPSPGRAEQVDGDTFKRAGLPNRRFEISAPAAGLRRRNRDNRRQGDAEGPL